MRGGSTLTRSFGLRCADNCSRRFADDAEKQKRMDLIRLEMEMERQAGNFFIPDKFEDKKWDELVRLETPEERRNFYRYLKKIELDEERVQRRRAKRVEGDRDRLRSINAAREHAHQYGLGKNALFPKIYLKSLNKIYRHNFVHAQLFGQKLVVDLGYEDHMCNSEIKNTVEQIRYAYSALKVDREPFHLHFCNADPRGVLAGKLKLAMPLLDKPKPLIEVAEKSYLEMFPKDKLVYLVPNCGVDLKYDHDDVYVIGGFVDRHGQGPISMAKANREGIRKAQFPINKYLNWKSGTNSLTIDQVVNVLLTMHKTMDWRKALEHVPTRKILRQNERIPRGFPQRLDNKI